jgi:hypothetical protein
MMSRGREPLWLGLQEDGGGQPALCPWEPWESSQAYVAARAAQLAFAGFAAPGQYHKARDWKAHT